MIRRTKLFLALALALLLPASLLAEEISLSRARQTAEAFLGKRDPDTRANRKLICINLEEATRSTDPLSYYIFNREGGDLQQIKDFTAMRDSEDTRRYKEFYGIDNNDYAFCDLIIDVNEKTPEEIENIILDKLAEKGLIER